MVIDLQDVKMAHGHWIQSDPHTHISVIFFLRLLCDPTALSLYATLLNLWVLWLCTQLAPICNNQNTCSKRQHVVFKYEPPSQLSPPHLPPEQGARALSFSSDWEPELELEDGSVQVGG